MEDGLRMVQSRACGAWALPGDPTCAGAARRLFRLVASGLSLEAGAVDDGVTMVSELAANTLHAQRRHPVPARPELWLYLRGTGPKAELVGKVFDALPGWLHGNVPGRTVARAPADAMSGRGLEVVHEMSAGRWGHHLSRSRLSGTGLRGKAVWFALPAPVAGRDAGRAAGRGSPATAGEAMTELENDLGARGFGDKLVRADDPGADMAVLSIASGLTVWCRSGAAWLRAPATPVQQWSYDDLVEVGEQAVRAYETTIARPEPGSLAAASRPAREGALAAKVKILALERAVAPPGRSMAPHQGPASAAASPGPARSDMADAGRITARSAERSSAAARAAAATRLADLRRDRPVGVFHGLPEAVGVHRGGHPGVRAGIFREIGHGHA
jgi:hypothetical protein